MKIPDEEAAEILSCAISCAKKIRSPWHRANLAARIAAASFEQGRSSMAEPFVDDLLENSCTLKTIDQALVILELAYAYALIGNEEQANELFSQGCELAKTLKDDDRYGILFKAAELLCELGRHPDAKAIADSIKSSVYRHTVLTVIVRGYLKNGNIEMAAATALEMKSLAGVVTEILLSVLKRGELSETERTAVKRLSSKA